MRCGGQVARKKWKSLKSTISLFAETRIGREGLDFLLFMDEEEASPVIAR